MANETAKNEQTQGGIEELMAVGAATAQSYINRERQIRKQVYDGEEIERIFLKAKIPVTPDEIAAMPFEQRGDYGAAPTINKRTYNPEPGIICEQDVETVLRDGKVMYSDIYRPDTTEKVPAIIAWAWFGKRPSEGMAENVVMGVPNGTVSTMAKFEGPDPGYWVHQGYAVANADPRGSMRSEGDLSLHDREYGECGYDYIEWIAQQPWCNGKVALAGNSGLAFSQWRIAMTNPPHLAAIAPWEGYGDYYREGCFEGGIPEIGFNTFIVGGTTGLGYVDDYVAMMKKYPLMNNYWQSKIPEWENIKVPAYIVAGWSHFHLLGTLKGFMNIKSKKKWLRAHREFEWPDYYNNENLEDLKKFFDRYLKDIHNGWEQTPKVRLDVIDAYDFDYTHNRPENEWPLKRTKYTKLYLNAKENNMSYNPITVGSKVSYDSILGLTTFDFKFEEETEITGYIKAHIWVEAAEYDDMDMFFNIKKTDAQGNEIPWNVLGEPHPGAWGKQRVSMRTLDEDLSTDYMPILAHNKVQKLSKGEIVPIDVLIWPSSRIWNKGEQLRLQVAGRYIRKEGWFEPFMWDVDNKGNHIIHTGAEYDSYIQVPIIPPKYVAGEKIYR